jgi:hypothetical protein
MSAIPRFVLTTEGELHGVNTPENREIVRRIHACVAACEGISTAELEQGIIREIRQVLTNVIPILEQLRAPAKQDEPQPKIENAAA